MSKKNEPLTESYFYILLCLYGKANHGYGIMQDTMRLSAGQVKIGSGTMYGAVSNMIKKGWIEEVENPEDDRKKLYQLTASGQNVLWAEKERLEHLVQNARQIMSGEVPADGKAVWTAE